jgi:hypothetical protein
MTEALKLPDITREVEHFLKAFDRLARLPFVSDDELQNLFSPVLIEMLNFMGRYNREHQICAGCNDRCCRLVNCEIYDSSFDSCPVFNLRPLLCRMHYCLKFTRDCEQEVKLIGDIFLEGLLAAQKTGSCKTALFDSPPLSAAAPLLAGKLNAIMADFKAGSLAKPDTLQAIRSEAEKYRTLA